MQDQPPTLTITKPIHILHIIDKLSTSGSGVHGPTKTLERSIPLFDPDRFRFSVYSLRAPEEAGDLLARKGAQVVFLNKGKFDPLTITHLLALIKRNRPDILHLHGYGSTTFGRIVSVITGIPNIVHERAVIPNQPFYQTWADTLLAPFSSKAIAVSDPVREFMITQRKEKPDNVETIIIGIPISEQPVMSREMVRQRLSDLGIPPNGRVICCVGRLSAQKGQIYLLKAALDVVNRFADAYFLLVGDGPDFEMLQSFARENNLSEKVVFAGYRQDVQDLLKISEIFCLPSLWEGFPNALVEAMSLRKPDIRKSVRRFSEIYNELASQSH